MVTMSAYNRGDRLLEHRLKSRLDSGPTNLDSELYLLYICCCQSVPQLEIFSTTTLPMYISQIPVDVQFHLFIISKIISFNYLIIIILKFACLVLHVLVKFSQNVPDSQM